MDDVENRIALLLKHYASSQVAGRWAMSTCGIGPVIASGLLAHFDITRAPTVGHFWRFAGLDPTQSWLGKDRAKVIIEEKLGRKKGPVTDGEIALIEVAVGRSPGTLMALIMEDTRRAIRKELEKEGEPTTAEIVEGLLQERLSKAKTVSSLSAVAAKRPWNADLKTLCVHPENRVHTKRGHIPIREVTIGDEVLTHQGRYRRVTEVLSRPYQGLMHKILSHRGGNVGPFLTGEHPVLARMQSVIHYYSEGRRRWRKGSTKRQRNYEVAEAARTMVSEGYSQRQMAHILERSESAISLYVNGRLTSPPIREEWVRADSLQIGWDLLIPAVHGNPESVCITLPRDQAVERNGLLYAEGRWPNVPAGTAHGIPPEVEIDEEVAYVLGLYLAEGHSSNNNFGWSLHILETRLKQNIVDVMRKHFGLDSYTEENLPNNSMQVMFSSKILARWFRKTFGHGAANKCVPIDWLEKLATPQLISMVCGIFDGDGYVDHNGSRMLTTRSQPLAYWVADALRRIDSGGSVAVYQQDGKPLYKVRECEAPRGPYVAIKSLDRNEYSGLVYNLEVEDDHSYVVEGVAVHNCWKIGQSFIKVQGNKNDIYGAVYAIRRELENNRNEAGEFADQAARKLETYNIDKSTEAYKAYSQGKLPPAHLLARASRYATKLFLAHLHHVMWEARYGEPPRKPYVIEKLGHTSFIKPPNWPMV